ncbi:hypothetical protein [Nocardiopsis sp. CA-288880]|uniref:hypothetical protein n=1 Tax=Nocardiopsis sp. CA-288880 TaxID=3239995 RepID=UPI003D9852E0
MTDQLLDKHDVAARLKVSPRLVEKKCAKREWPFVFVARKYRFTKEHVEQIVALLKEETVPHVPHLVAARSNVTPLRDKIPPRLRKKQQVS